jgi:hypothetical protein
VQVIFVFCKASILALGPTQTPIRWIPGELSSGVRRLKREANHSPHLVPTLRIDGVIAPFSYIIAWRAHRQLYFTLLFFMARRPLVDQVLIAGVSRSHSDTSHSVGLLWTSDRPSQRPLPDNTQRTQETDIHAPGGIRTLNSSKQAAADPRLRPRRHWDRLTLLYKILSERIKFLRIHFAGSPSLCLPSVSESGSISCINSGFCVLHSCVINDTALGVQCPRNDISCGNYRRASSH